MHAAGVDRSVSVSAVQWQSGDKGEPTVYTRAGQNKFYPEYLQVPPHGMLEHLHVVGFFGKDAEIVAVQKATATASGKLWFVHVRTLRYVDALQVRRAFARGRV